MPVFRGCSMHTRELARKAREPGDGGTNDLLVSDVPRTSEMQVWFLSEHVAEMPPVYTKTA